VRTSVDCGTLVTFREHPMTGRATMTSVHEPDDHQVGGDITVLVKNAAAGDQVAWDALVARYTNLLWSVARGYRLERSDAADVVQVAWLRLVEHLPQLRDPERIGAWLATTVRRECLQVIARRRRGTPVDDEILTGLPDGSPPVDTALLAQEQATALWAAFEAIAPRCQRLLRVLMADPAPSYHDVSVALDMPVGSIGPTRARCLDRLRDLLDEAETSAGGGR
jgi:RNA polymerase sigma factor (sigma-70 family)